MSYAAELTAIESRFATAWGATTSVHYEGSNFEPPMEDAWVRLAIRPGQSRRIEVAAQNALHRHAGVILIQIFAPRNRGTRQARELADQAAAVFRGQTFDGLRCRAPAVTVVGTERGWFQVNVSIPFERDEAF